MLALAVPYVCTVSQARSALLRSGRPSRSAEFGQQFFMKTAEWDPLAVKTFSTGSICEFEDGKQRPHLGVVLSVEVGAKKGGAVYEVADAKDKKHKVYAKSLHAIYPSDPMTKSGTPPAEVLDDYLNVAGCTPTQLGVELEMLELGWEVCAEDEASDELSQAANLTQPTMRPSPPITAHASSRPRPRHHHHHHRHCPHCPQCAPPSFTEGLASRLPQAAIMGEIDPSYLENPIQQYKAYRLLTSDLGKIFFKQLHAGMARGGTHAAWLAAAPVAIGCSRGLAACSGLPLWAREEGERRLGSEASLRCRSKRACGGALAPA